MKSAVYTKAGQVGLAEIDRPQIEAPDDAIIRIVRTCVCGSDLWSYRNPEIEEGHRNSGHEAIGIVEEVGDDVTTVKAGDFVIAPFTHGCGECDACRAGYDGTCDRHIGTNWSNGVQAEYIRFHFANWALVKIPGQPSDYTEGMLKSLLTLADVMPTGYHAARVANVQKGDKVVVIGDGAVGQCAVIAAKMRGASQIVLMSRHQDRQQMALESGATAVVAERGEEGIAKVREILGGGADAALECVGTEEARYQARLALANQRTLDARTGQMQLAGGVPDVLPEDAPYFVKDYFDYYKQPRGYHARGLNSNDGWAVQAHTSFANTRFLYYTDEIRNAVLVIHGDKAHSYYMGKDAFEKLTGDNKKMITVEGASHTDLYDRLDVIPFEEIERFLKENM